MKRASDIYCRETIAERLLERVVEAFGDQTAGGVLRRFEVGIDRTVLLDWLAIQKESVRIYFSGRDDEFEMAGIGAADMVGDDGEIGLRDMFEAIERNLADADGAIRYYGGMCFDGDAGVSEEWQSFGRRRFVVPRFEVCRNGDDHTFAFNVMVESGDDIESVRARLTESLDRLNFECAGGKAKNSNMTKTISRTDLPDRSHWIDDVAGVIENMPGRGVSKVVLARESEFEFLEAVEPLEMLREIKQNNSNAYDFCFQFDAGSAFIGSTPECLFRMDGGEVYSEAVAGTVVKERGRDELLGSVKEIEEHRYVYDNVMDAMEEMCSSVDIVSDREVIELRHLLHICSRFEGEVKDGVRVCDIMKSLHPTAAVNGFPRESAMAWIREIEGFSRGWYAGPVGWVSRAKCDFAVGIRSALISGRRVSLFAGAGIIGSCDPASEWDEVENKLRQFLELLG